MSYGIGFWYGIRASSFPATWTSSCCCSYRNEPFIIERCATIFWFKSANIHHTTSMTSLSTRRIPIPLRISRPPDLMKSIIVWLVDWVSRNQVHSSRSIGMVFCGNVLFARAMLNGLETLDDLATTDPIYDDPVVWDDSAVDDGLGRFVLVVDVILPSLPSLYQDASTTSHIEVSFDVTCEFLLLHQTHPLDYYMYPSQRVVCNRHPTLFATTC